MGKSSNSSERLPDIICPRHFRAVRTALHRKQRPKCHLLRSKLLYLRFHADSIPSALTKPFQRFAVDCRPLLLTTVAVTSVG
jgi:hypothetical protein